MAMSKSARITLLLAIDVVFFFVELIVGYAVGSLALIADSFHMLNDVMSLIVALYAIKLAAQDSTDSRYSYGWHRAEILAALINGVFLLALCFSISLEALERFFSTPEISNPKLIVIVGSLGLASNIVGLFLFHGHSHGPGHTHDHGSRNAGSSANSVVSLPTGGDTTPTQKTLQRHRSRSRSRSRPRSDSYASLYGHPAATRASLVQTAQEIAHARSPSPTDRLPHSRHQSLSDANRATTIHDGDSNQQPGISQISISEDGESSPLLQHDLDAISPTPDNQHTHAHSHSGSMNMHALILHVLGDALGNVGVIATGLVIWLSSWSLKYYFDPVISLVIAAIIFSSALPLVRSASFILLQGVPPNISLDRVRDSILAVDGVLSLHELHIWQLSETKVIASVHVLASRSYDFMPVAVRIRNTLHHHGIHSCTIQPEYPRLPEDGIKDLGETPCLITCPSDQACDPQENACCPPLSATV